MKSRGARIGRAIARIISALVQGVAIAWATIAICYSDLSPLWLRASLATAFAAFCIWAVWIARTRRPLFLAAGLFIAVVAWWATLEPSNDRPWRTEVAVTPRAHVDGDRVRITGVRNFSYRSVDDFTPRYEEREVLLSHVTGIDFYISYWMPGPVGHTFLSFAFDNAPPLSISIEARPEVGEGFDPLASLFKQFELIYVVGDERDLVRLRTNYRNEEVFLYRTTASPEQARRLFVVYLRRLNELADHAEFYHLLSNNCSLNIVRYANAAGRVGRFHIKHYLNGLFDSYLYVNGGLDTTLPFEELRRRSKINDAAHAAGDAEDFPNRIRAALPTPAT